MLAGHQSELRQPGDFKVFDVAGESAIIVRGTDGELSAFANVCRHRGSLVCLKRQGSVRKFVCPYHGWTYDLNGRLIAARNMPDDLNFEDYGLKRLPVDVLCGLVLVSFSDDPVSLQGAKREMTDLMSMFGFENLKVAAHQVYSINANWKLAVENYLECYHCANAHPEYAKMHTLMLDEDKRERLQGAMRARMPDCGVRDAYIDRFHTKSLPGEMGYSYGRTALFEGYQTGSRDGSPLAPLLAELTGYDGGASDFVLGPFSYALAYNDHVVCYVFTPVDVAHSRCELYWLVREDADAGRDYDVDELTWLWDVTTESDKEIIVNNWKGIRSIHYEPGPLSRMEIWQSGFIDWLVAELAAA